MDCAKILLIFSFILFTLFIIFSLYLYGKIIYYKTDFGQSSLKYNLMEKINNTIEDIDLKYSSDFLYFFTLESMISNISVFPLNPENITISFINNTDINITLLGLKGLAKSLTTLSYLSLDIDGDLLNADVTMIIDTQPNPFSLKKLELSNLDFDFKSKNLEKIYQFSKMIFSLYKVTSGINNYDFLTKKSAEDFMLVRIIYDYVGIIVTGISYVSDYLPIPNIEKYIEDKLFYFLDKFLSKGVESFISLYNNEIVTNANLYLNKNQWSFVYKFYVSFLIWAYNNFILSLIILFFILSLYIFYAAWLYKFLLNRGIAANDLLEPLIQDQDQ